MCEGRSDENEKKSANIFVSFFSFCFSFSSVLLSLPALLFHLSAALRSSDSKQKEERREKEF